MKRKKKLYLKKKMHVLALHGTVFEHLASAKVSNAILSADTWLIHRCIPTSCFENIYKKIILTWNGRSYFAFCQASAHLRNSS